MGYNSKTSFWQLLDEHEVVIPVLQRDYAQGRKGKEDLRNRFLCNIKDSLCNIKELKLDFVYGSVENGQMSPLDGQQRLTTLWLLHWFVAFRAGKLKDQNTCHRLTKFYYATRPSSTEFCRRLVEEFSKIEPAEVEEIVDYIKNQHWYYRHYNFDPTIQAFLRMIQGDRSPNNKDNPKPINGLEQFWGSDANYQDLWNVLIKDDCPIKFYHKDMMDDDMPLVDDLYIKMNARGKQLTPFENFKAELIGYDDNKYFDIENVDEDKEFVSCLDNDWVGLFWPYKHSNYKRVDEIYFKFINQFMLNFYLLVSKESDQSIDKTNLYQLLSSAHSFSKIEDYKEILDYKVETDTKVGTFKKRFLYTMNGLVHYKCLCDSKKKNINEQLENVLGDYRVFGREYEMFFIPQYDYEKGSVEKWENQENLPVTELRQIPQVIFFGICCFFETLNIEECHTLDDIDQELTQWVRFCYNISYNPLVNNIGGLRGALRVVDEMAQKGYCLVTYSKLADLSAVPILNAGSAREQLEEEYYKAKYQKDDEDMAKLINDAEKYTFFKGNIRFLLWNENGEYNKDIDAFKTKYESAKLVFAENDTFEGKIQNEFSFPNYFYACHQLSEVVTKNDNGGNCIMFNNSGESWKMMLNNKALSKTTHYFLTHKLLKSDELKNQTNLPNMDYNSMTEEEKKRLNFVQDIIFEEGFVHNLMQMKAMVGSNLYLRKKQWGWGLYPKNAHANIKFIKLGSSRNKILKQLKDKDMIKIDCEVGNSSMFYGWDIIFDYQGKRYKWTYDDKLRFDDNDSKFEQLSFDIKYDDFINKLNALNNKHSRILTE